MSAGRTPTVLALDASTEACSVAIGHDGQLVHRCEVTPRGHASRMLPMVEAVLGEAGLRREDVDLVTCGRGPGSFTGVRIGLGVAQGIAMALDLPVVTLSTLQVLAQGCHRRLGLPRVCVAIDARMAEIYVGCYELDPETGLMHAAVPDAVTAPESLAVPAHWGRYAGSGTGWAAHAAVLARRGNPPVRTEPEALPEARDMVATARDAHARGEVLAAESLVPTYLRDQVTRPTPSE